MSYGKFSPVKNTVDDLFPAGEEIPTGEEMAKYCPIDPPSNSGLIYCDPKLRPITAITAKGNINFPKTPPCDNVFVGNGSIDDHGYLHGEGVVTGNLFTVRANFVHGKINDTEAIFYFHNGTVKKACILLDTFIY
tara:strand:- start:861 stop:1265 length:405 start_codon:yes stop_codon:yes gene_type:complete